MSDSDLPNDGRRRFGRKPIPGQSFSPGDNDRQRDASTDPIDDLPGPHRDLVRNNVVALVRADPRDGAQAMDQAHEALRAADTLAADDMPTRAVSEAYAAGRLAIDALMADRGLRVHPNQSDRHAARVPVLEAELRYAESRGEIGRRDTDALVKAYDALRRARNAGDYNRRTFADPSAHIATARKVVRQMTTAHESPRNGQ